MIDMYCMLFDFGRISFNVGPLCISLISAWLSHALGPSITTPYHLLWVPTQSYCTILLFHLLPTAVLWCPSLVVIVVPPGMVSAAHMPCASRECTWYGLLSSLSCKENVPLKHLILLNTLPYSSCILCVMALLLLLSCIYIIWWIKVID